MATQSARIEGIKMNGSSGYANGHGSNSHHSTSSEMEEEDLEDVGQGFGIDATKDKILGLTSYSTRLEEVLLALLKDQQMMKDRLLKESR